ncbi:MAG: xanthine dehydrogenase small subunit, partial [Paraglaciecola sp.]
MISFLLNNEFQQISDSKADTTLLNYLREDQHLCGTKEGCASGDCGACTVVVAELNAALAPDNSPLHYRAINSCVSFLSTLQGKQLITVEHLADDANLHPVQQAMVDHHGSQCGFCTPGFVMSMFAFYHRANHAEQAVDREQIDLALSGNLCRCTGYRPIIDATLSACAGQAKDQFIARQDKTIETLNKINQVPAGVLVVKPAGTEGLFMPGSRKALAEAVRQYPDARLFAGSTDLALEVTQQLKDIQQLISLS